MQNLNKNLLLAALAGIVISVGVVFVLSKSQVTNKATVNNSPNITNETPNKVTDTTISVKPIDNASYDLSISTKSPKTLSAFSIRLTYPYTTADYNTQSFTPNPDLVASGWAFPIKEVSLDNANNLINIDISGINPTVTGYSLTNEVSLGTLVNFPPLTFAIDKSQTKILEKNSEEINYNFNQ